ncbi:YidB family protein [Streptomyces sp. NPDC090109]|uniref:YidB family protein n=1 Tax=unclassified Streptomyces TaxID=2593676 RepID=UPI000EF78D8D|nr:YidB family protein [Streptomyces sp. S1]
MAGNDLGSLLGGLLGGSGQGGSGGAGGILGSLLGALAGGQTGQGAQSGAAGAGGAAAGAAGSPLGGLLDLLTRSGLLDQAQSWIGTGENKSVSGAQIAQALPDDTLRKVADDAGVSTEEAADRIARSLPQAVDKLTPDGSLPQGDSLEDIIRQQRL